MLYTIVQEGTDLKFKRASSIWLQEHDTWLLETDRPDMEPDRNTTGLIFNLHNFAKLLNCDCPRNILNLMLEITRILKNL